MTAAYLADTDRLGLGRPDHEPLASETIARDRRPDRRADRPRPRLRGRRATSTSGCAPTRATASSRTATSSRWTRARASRAPSARRIRSTSRSGRPRRRARTPPGTPPGGAGGPAGTSSARRWPRSSWALEFDIHGGGIDLVFPHHENEAAQTMAARGRRARPRLDAQRDAPARAARRWPSRSATSARSHEALDDAGRDALLLYFVAGHYRQPLAFSEELLDDAARGVRAHPRGGAPARGRAEPRGHGAAAGALLRRPGRRLQHARGARRPSSTGCARPTGATTGRSATPTCARCSTSWRSSQPARRGRGRGPGRRVAGAARRSARTARAAGDFAEADRLRDELRERGWEVRDGPAGPELAAASDGRLRAQRRARGAARPARGARGCGRTAARRGADWLAGAPLELVPDAARDRAPVRLARPPGRLRRGRATTAYADAAALLAAPEPLIVALDEVQDPQNLGAVAPHRGGRGAPPAS